MTTLALLCSAHAPAGVLPAVHDLAQRGLWRKLSSLPAAPLEARPYRLRPPAAA